MNKLYAVYGTLKEGFGNHYILNNSSLVHRGFVSIPFKMVSLGGFPGLIPDIIKNSIFLEIYEVDSDETEARLDRLEGYPNFYDKYVIDTPVGEANVYYLKDEEYQECDLVETGNWSR